MSLHTNKLIGLGLGPFIGFSQCRMTIRQKELDEVKNTVLLELESRLQTVQKDNIKYINSRIENMMSKLKKHLEETILKKVEEVVTKIVDMKNIQTEQSCLDLRKSLSENLKKDIDSKLENLEEKLRNVIREEFKDMMIREDGWEKLN